MVVRYRYSEIISSSSYSGAFGSGRFSESGSSRYGVSGISNRCSD